MFLHLCKNGAFFPPLKPVNISPTDSNSGGVLAACLKSTLCRIPKSNILALKRAHRCVAHSHFQPLLLIRRAARAREPAAVPRSTLRGGGGPSGSHQSAGVCAFKYLGVSIIFSLPWSSSALDPECIISPYWVLWGGFACCFSHRAAD